MYVAVGESEIVTGDYYCEAANNEFLLTLFDQTLIAQVKAQVNSELQPQILESFVNTNKRSESNNTDDDDGGDEEEDDGDGDGDSFNTAGYNAAAANINIINGDYYDTNNDNRNGRENIVTENSLNPIYTTQNDPNIIPRSRRMMPVYDEAKLVFYVDDYQNKYDLAPNGLIKVVAKTTVVLNNSTLDTEQLNSEGDRIVHSEAFNGLGYTIIKSISDRMSENYWKSSMQKIKDSNIMSESFLTYVGSRVNRIPDIFTNMNSERKLLVNLLILDILNDDTNINWMYKFIFRIRKVTKRLMIRINIGKFYTDLTRPQWREFDQLLIALNNEAQEHKRSIEINMQDLVTPLMSVIVTQKQNENISDCSKLINSQKIYMCFAKNLHLFENSTNYPVVTALFSEFSATHHQLEVDKLLVKRLELAHTEFLKSTNKFTPKSLLKSLHPFVLHNFNATAITLSTFDIKKL